MGAERTARVERNRHVWGQQGTRGRRGTGAVDGERRLRRPGARGEDTDVLLV